MDTSKILSADLLDLIFDNRNKLYGAYELRRSYNKRIKKALILTFTLALLVITGSVLASSLKQPAKGKLDTIEVTLSQIPDEPEPEPLPEPEKLPEPEPVRTEQFTTIRIVENTDDPPPTQNDLDSAVVDLKTQEGVADKGLEEEPKSLDDGRGIIEPKKQEEEILTFVEVQAKYNGNWEKFLLRNLRGDVPIENGAPAGRYTVLVQFVVDKEGNVSDIRTLSNIGYGMEEEATRVLRKAEKWEPAIQNGYKVKAYCTQRITFEVNGE